MTTEPVATTSVGRFLGVAGETTNHWLGIPYAQPPLGNDRFRAPTPAHAVAELTCDTYSPVCPQLTNPIVTLPTHVTMGPNCLTLNVWAPTQHTSALPVMVWVHGGAFMFGSSHQPEYDGTALAEHGNVIVVTLNYRVGPLGFADLSRCAEPGKFDTNVGIRDVLLALHWVQHHIHAFGGDPQQVTLFGESSGGAIVTTLLASPHASGLFHRAIAQSPPATSVYGSDRAFHMSKRLLRRLGLSAGDATELRHVPTEEILRRATELYERVPEEMPGTLAFAPVIDGDIVPEAPVDVLHEGRGLTIPLIIGTNRNEASVFKYMQNPVLPITEDRIRRMLDEVKKEQPDAEVPSLEHIRETTEGIRRQSVGLGIARDIGFRLPAVWIAEGHQGGVWLYRFDHTTPLLSLVGLGAPHASEIPYVWRNLDTPLAELALKLGGRKHATEVSARMSGWWASFAHGIAPWPEYTLPERKSLVIEREERVVSDLDASLRDGWGEGVLAFS